MCTLRIAFMARVKGHGLQISSACWGQTEFSLPFSKMFSFSSFLPFFPLSFFLSFFLFFLSFFLFFLNLYLLLKDLGDLPSPNLCWLLEKIIRLSTLTFRKDGVTSRPFPYFTHVLQWEPSLEFCLSGQPSFRDVPDTSFLFPSHTHKGLLRLAKANAPLFPLCWLTK